MSIFSVIEYMTRLLAERDLSKCRDEDPCPNHWRILYLGTLYELKHFSAESDIFYPLYLGFGCLWTLPCYKKLHTHFASGNFALLNFAD